MIAARKIILAALLSLMTASATQAEEVKTVATANADKLTNANLADQLKKFGYKVEVVPTEIGDSICLVSLESDGWNFVIEVSVNARGGINMVAPLVEIPADKVSSPKFLQLLEVNYDLGACSFCYRAADSKVCLRTQTANATQTGLVDSFATLTEKIRTTFPLWGQGGF